MVLEQKIKKYPLKMGCDPELFINLNNKVIGSEKVLVEDKVKTNGDKITKDGVQVEFNPQPQTCRAYLGNHIRLSFIDLVEMLQNKGMEINFNQVVTVSKKEMDSLSDKAREFGCAPSNNFYTGSVSVIGKDPKKYKKRSAGGHIHIGTSYDKSYNKEDLEVDYPHFEPSRIIPVLDIIVGNTCVLLDRDKGNVERRKTYGRAGEYRVPDKGRIEYRTLSNFWLKDYKLMSFVMGLARYAYSIVVSNLDSILIKKVNMKDIQRAINKNSFNDALNNWKYVKDFIMIYTSPSYVNDFPLCQDTVHLFEFFVAKGLDFWFPKNEIVKRWTAEWEGHGNGWESFLKDKVQGEYDLWIKQGK
jgi:hypothetical protein